MFSGTPKSAIVTLEPIPYAYIPPEVSAKSLHSNFKLLDEKTIDRLKKSKPSIPMYRRYNRKELDIDFGVYYGKKGFSAIFNENGRTIILGEGLKGSVKLIQNLESKKGEWKALKRVRLPYGSKNYLAEKQNFLHECAILYQLGKTDEPEGIIHHNKGYIKMDLETGVELFNLMVKRNSPAESFDLTSPMHWPDCLWLDIAIKCTQQVKAVHDAKIFNRDIKLENILVDIARQCVKLVDHGYSETYSLTESGFKFFKGPFCGTMIYVAPEIYFQHHKEGICTYTESSEVYALGISLIFLLLNHKIEMVANKLGQFTKIESRLNPRSSTCFEEDHDVNLLLKKMVSPNPLIRPTVVEVLNQLMHFQELLIKKYPEQLELTNNIYLKAREVEVARLKKIHEEVAALAEPPSTTPQPKESFAAWLGLQGLFSKSSKAHTEPMTEESSLGFDGPF